MLFCPSESIRGLTSHLSIVLLQDGRNDESADGLSMQRMRQEAESERQTGTQFSFCSTGSLNRNAGVVFLLLCLHMPHHSFWRPKLPWVDFGSAFLGTTPAKICLIKNFWPGLSRSCLHWMFFSKVASKNPVHHTTSSVFLHRENALSKLSKKVR